MPKKDVRRKLRRATILYWTLLIYIVAALVWWFISLEKQNREMTDLRTIQLKQTTDSLAAPSIYQTGIQKINKDYKKNKAKYIGEGSIFLLVICVGAV